MRRSIVSSGVPSPRQVRPPGVRDRREQRAAWRSGRRARRRARAACGAARGRCTRRATASATASRGTGAVAEATGSCVGRGAPGAATPGTGRRSGGPHQVAARRRRLPPPRRRPRTIAAGTRAALPMTEPARGGDLVGERDDRRLERPAAVVGRARAGRPSPAARRQPIATLTSPSRHGAAERVGDRPRRGDRRRSARASASLHALGADASGSSGSSVRSPSRDVRGVDAGVRAHEPVPGLGDHEVVAARRRRGRSRGDDRGVAVVGSGTTRPSAFETTFCVTTTTSPSRAIPPRAARRQQRREVVAGPISGSPVMGIDARSGHVARQLQRGSRERLGPGVVGHDRVGDGRPRTPSASIALGERRGRRRRSPRPPAGPRKRSADAGRARPRRRPPASAGRPSLPRARRRRSPLTPDRRSVAARGDRLADPRHREDRPDRDDRVGRADHDGVGAARSPPARPARAARASAPS